MLVPGLPSSYLCLQVIVLPNPCLGLRAFAPNQYFDSLAPVSGQHFDGLRHPYPKVCWVVQEVAVCLIDQELEVSTNWMVAYQIGQEQENSQMDFPY